MTIKEILAWSWKGFSVHSYKHPIWWDKRYAAEKKKLEEYIGRRKP